MGIYNRHLPKHYYEIWSLDHRGITTDVSEYVILADVAELRPRNRYIVEQHNIDVTLGLNIRYLSQLVEAYHKYMNSCY